MCMCAFTCIFKVSDVNYILSPYYIFENKSQNNSKWAWFKKRTVLHNKNRNLCSFNIDEGSEDEAFEAYNLSYPEKRIREV